MLEKFLTGIQYIALAVSVFVLLALGFGQLGHWWWVFELLSHFPLQYVWISTVCIVVLAFGTRKSLLFVPLLSIFISLGFLLPVYFQGPQRIPTAADGVEETANESVSLLFMNVGYANDNYRRIAQEIDSFDPDMVCLAEASAVATREIANRVEQFSTVEYVEGPGAFDMSLLSSVPAKIITAEAGESIPALFATLPVEESDLSVWCVHPVPPTSRDYAFDRNVYLRSIASWASSESSETVVVGDMNATPWSPEFSLFVEESGLRDARQRFGTQTTWPAMLPSALRIPIDHTFVSEGVTVLRREVGENIGSDHLPVFIELQLN